MTPGRTERGVLVGLVVPALVWSGLAPVSWLTWLMEVVWVLAGLPGGVGVAAVPADPAAGAARVRAALRRAVHLCGKRRWATGSVTRSRYPATTTTGLVISSKVSCPQLWSARSSSGAVCCGRAGLCPDHTAGVPLTLVAGRRPASRVVLVNGARQVARAH